MKDGELLQKYNEIWEKVKNSLKKEFDSEPVYDEQFLKAKIKSYNGKIDTHFHDNKIQNKDFQFICLSLSVSLKYFQTNVNILFKKKRFLSKSLMIQNFLLIPINKILIKKILMNKNLKILMQLIQKSDKTIFFSIYIKMANKWHYQKN